MVVMFLQRELATAIDVTVKLYYKGVLDPSFNSPSRMQEFMEKAMDQVRKENFNAFLKHLFIYNPILGNKFLEQVYMHYDMFSEPKMLIEKFQMLVTSYVSSKQTFKWFKRWNQPVVAREATKFPKQGFLDAICAKWFQKATFQFQVGSHYSN